MIVLAIDTALSACSVGLFDVASGETIAVQSLPMERGHAEAFPPALEAVLSRLPDGTSPGRIAVTVGPGSYTGLRVGVSAGRALALAFECPVVGVTTLAALAAPLIAEQAASLVAAAIDARHGQIYFQVFTPNGRAMGEPKIMALRDASRAIGAGPVRLVGSGAGMLGHDLTLSGLTGVGIEQATAPDPFWVARLGGLAAAGAAPPRPLYLKGPDARPQDTARLLRR